MSGLVKRICTLISGLEGLTVGHLGRTSVYNRVMDELWLSVAPGVSTQAKSNHKPFKLS